MGSHPGDLFVVRAIGALVARAGHGAMPQEGAAAESLGAEPKGV